MHKSTLWLIVAILCIYFSLVSCDNVTDRTEQESSDLLDNDGTSLREEARRKIRHGFYSHSLWGFYGLAIGYLIKVKIFVVAFFLGSAVYFGLRYFWPHKCVGNEYYKDGSIILDHPPSFAHHHDHVPYSLDHEHYDSGSFTSSGPSSFDPYSAYSGHIETDNSLPGTGSGGAAEESPSDAPTFRRKRSEPRDLEQETGLFENLARQMGIQEEQIGEFMLSFLGLDTAPCRRRFVCEMEFKSKRNPLTSMAFRVVGHSFFAKYTNNQNPLKTASSFEECAAANAECVFIENTGEAEEDAIDETQQAAASEETSTNQINEESVASESSLENNDIIEEANDSNLRAEISNSFRRRLRGDRYLKFQLNIA